MSISLCFFFAISFNNNCQNFALSVLRNLLTISASSNDSNMYLNTQSHKGLLDRVKTLFLPTTKHFITNIQPEIRRVSA